MNPITNETILVMDFGGAFKELAARAVRSFGVYSEIRPGSYAIEKIRKFNPIGIILALGENAANYEHLTALDIPILAISNWNNDENDREKIRSFTFETCTASGDYNLDVYIDHQINQIKSVVGNEKILLALSGGVDSSVCAALLSRAVPGQLVCIFVDHGFMRFNEGDRIETAFAGQNLNFVRINAQDRFLSKVAGVADPEKKRKIIGEEFIAVFEEEAKKLGHIPYFAQGTIYADIVESGGEYGAVIKSHHNVGGLPEKLGFNKIVEPLAGLFKDEVRQLGQKLGLPDELTLRQPFPGPGLAIRVTGEITKDRLETVRHADALVTEEIEKFNFAELGLATPSQYFAVITNTRSVGTKGHERTYDYAIVVRAVITDDYMTCTYATIPHELLAHISSRITSEVSGVSRVAYDITSKPPGTIEWE